MIKVNIHFLLWSFDQEKNQEQPCLTARSLTIADQTEKLSSEGA